jgi:hypothetical protein
MWNSSSFAQPFSTEIMASPAQRLQLQGLEDLQDRFGRFQEDYLALHWE